MRSVNRRMLHCERLVLGERAMGLNAVAERIVIFPSGAFWRAAAALAKKVSDRQKRTRHNMGLCRIGGEGMGGGANSQRGTRRLGLRLRMLRIFTRNVEKPFLL